jgi:glycerate 2-kinase
MIIKNFDQLATTELRKQALLIAEAGLKAINTPTVVREKVQYTISTQKLTVAGQVYDLKKYKRVICVGFGKAAFSAVTELQKILQDRISCGFVIDLHEGDMGTITCRVGTHPHPTLVNVEATKELVEMLSAAVEDDLVICVASGGGSALLCYPHDMTCEAETSIIAALTVKGATIQELNTVRKHISKVKGGNLAKACYPATVIGLIFSDVPGNDLSMVASGPTVLDTTVVQDAAEILNRYDVLKMCQLPSCNLYETPKEDKYFKKVTNVLMVSGQLLLHACRRKADDLGFRAEVFSDQFSEEARTLASQVTKVSPAARTCLLGAGESTIKVIGSGMGGRNQELALSALAVLKESQVLVCIATDGMDNTDAAGAIADAYVLQKAARLQLDSAHYLDNNDSYHFFEQTGDLIFTGQTGANVSDFFVLLSQ